jgi:hypothetical protein
MQLDSSPFAPFSEVVHPRWMLASWMLAQHALSSAQEPVAPLPPVEPLETQDGGAHVAEHCARLWAHIVQAALGIPQALRQALSPHAHVFKHVVRLEPQMPPNMPRL